jgi:hypothetical protein
MASSCRLGLACEKGGTSNPFEDMFGTDAAAFSHL